MNSLLRLLIICTLVVIGGPTLEAQTSKSFQNNPKALELNTTSLERKRKGYAKYPVVQCPGVKAKYLEFLGKLEKIKERIVSEACPAEEQKEIQEEVDNVKDLVGGEKRKNFTTIINKGLAEGGEVSDEDAEAVRSYIESIVTTTAAVTGLTTNSACFDDESENITLATLSSIISEASGAIGAVAGPMGAKITLGGKVAAGLIDSVGAIVKARETYCKASKMGFGDCQYDAASEQAYVSTLCSYYQFKFDIDEITNPSFRLMELGHLRRQTDQQLQIYSYECEECNDIINHFENSLYGVQNSNEDKVSFSYQSTDISSFGTGDSQTVETTNKPLNQYSYEELLEVYSAQINQSAPNYSVERGGQLPTYYTVRTLRTQSWVEFELARVSQETDEDDADVGLGKVKVEQRKIEQFLFEDEAPKFITFAANRAQKSVTPFLELIHEGYNKIDNIEAEVVLQPDPSRTYNQAPSYPAEALADKYLIKQIVDYLHDIFLPQDIQFTNSLTETLTPAEIRRRQRKISSYIESLRFDLMGELQAVKRNYAVFRDYCRLFEYGKLAYHGPVGDACIEGHEQKLSSLKFMFSLLEDTILGVYANEFTAGGFGRGTVLSDVNEPDKEYTRDWVGSLTKLLNEQTLNMSQNGINRIEPSVPAAEPDPSEATPIADETDSEIVSEEQIGDNKEPEEVPTPTFRKGPHWNNAQ